MLDPWIIEEIRRREGERRREREACRIELPLYENEFFEDRSSTTNNEETEEPKRGVIVIDL